MLHSRWWSCKIKLPGQVVVLVCVSTTYDVRTMYCLCIELQDRDKKVNGEGIVKLLRYSCILITNEPIHCCN
jgi:hypothetical protein